jgi:RNA polymerase sigma-32 factor
MFHIDKTISDYITYVKSIPVLSREEEIRLYKAWRDKGDYAARAKIINASLRYVTAVALQFKRYPIPIEELISEGNLGLLMAIDSRYDPDSGNRFVTFAVYWIRAYLFKHVVKYQNETNSLVKFRSKDFFKFHKEKVRAQNTYTTPSEVEQALVKSMNLPLKKVQQFMQATDKRDLSLSMDSHRSKDGSHLEIGDSLSSDLQRQDDYVVDHELQALYQESVKEAMSSLTPREIRIVTDRLMKDPEEVVSLKELGTQLGVSRERVRQLQTKVVKKLKVRLEPIRNLV